MSISIYLALIGLLLVVVPAAGDPELPPSNSIATIEKITPDAYASYENSGQLALIKQDESSYIANPNPGPIKDPCLPSFYDWFNLNYPSFQVWANSHCQPYRGAFGNACICVLFQVNPKFPPCQSVLQYQYADAMKVPEYLDSTGVAPEK